MRSECAYCEIRAHERQKYPGDQDRAAVRFEWKIPLFVATILGAASNFLHHSPTYRKYTAPPRQNAAYQHFLPPLYGEGFFGGGLFGFLFGAAFAEGYFFAAEKGGDGEGFIVIGADLTHEFVGRCY